MIGWVVLGLYLLGYVACWRTVTWFIVSDIADGSSVDGELLAISVFVGSLLTLFWPVILPGIAVNRICTRRGPNIISLIMPRAEKRKHFDTKRALADAELRLAVTQRERRIAELEREVGIR